MATTNPTNIDSAVPELWARLTLRDHKVKGFWGRFIGQAILQETSLLQSPGDLIHLQVTNPLAGAGVQGDTAVLRGNEESLSTTSMKVAPILYRNGVSSLKRSIKKSIVDLRMEAQVRLAEWGMTKMDSVRFTNFNASTLEGLSSETYSPNVYAVGGGSDVDAIGAGDTLTVAALQQIKVKLRTQRAKPIDIDGYPHYVLVTHPYSMYDLKRESEYRDIVREAQVRGDDNPLFRGSLAVIDGMILFEHENVPIVTNAGSQEVAKGIAFGAEAFVEGLDENVSWYEEEFDYGHELGIKYGFAFQPRRALELSSCQVYSESANPVS